MSGPSTGSAANAIPVWMAPNPSAPAQPFVGSQLVTAAAVRLPSQAVVQRVTLSAPTTNIAPIELGASGVSVSTGFALNPGQQVTLPYSGNLSSLYIIGANTVDKITWIGF